MPEQPPAIASIVACMPEQPPAIASIVADGRRRSRATARVAPTIREYSWAASLLDHHILPPTLPDARQNFPRVQLQEARLIIARRVKHEMIEAKLNVWSDLL